MQGFSITKLGNKYICFTPGHKKLPGVFRCKSSAMRALEKAILEYKELKISIADKVAKGALNLRAEALKNDMLPIQKGTLLSTLTEEERYLVAFGTGTDKKPKKEHTSEADKETGGIRYKVSASANKQKNKLKVRAATVSVELKKELKELEEASGSNEHKTTEE